MSWGLLSPSGRILASFGSRQEPGLRLWATADGSALSPWVDAPNSGIDGVTFSADERFAVAWTYDGDGFWIIPIGADAGPVVSLPGAESSDGPVGAVFVNSSQLVVWAERRLRIWNIETARPTSGWLSLATTIRGLVPSPDGKRVLAWGGRSRYGSPRQDGLGLIRVWDVETGQPASPVILHDSDNRMSLVGARFDPTGERILSFGGGRRCPPLGRPNGHGACRHAAWHGLRGQGRSGGGLLS